MKYLIYSGARDTGKSNSIYRITDFLINTKGYVDVNKVFPLTFSDFRCILEKEDKVILVQSYTDLTSAIKDLKKEINSNKNITHVITANRNEDDYMRNQFGKILEITSSDFIFEIPLGKVIRGKTRINNITWYSNGVLRIAKEIIKTPPFNF